MPPAVENKKLDPNPGAVAQRRLRATMSDDDSDNMPLSSLAKGAVKAEAEEDSDDEPLSSLAAKGSKANGAAKSKAKTPAKGKKRPAKTESDDDDDNEDR